MAYRYEKYILDLLLLYIDYNSCIEIYEKYFHAMHPLIKYDTFRDTMSISASKESRILTNNHSACKHTVRPCSYPLSCPPLSRCSLISILASLLSRGS